MKASNISLLFVAGLALILIGCEDPNQDAAKKVDETMYALNALPYQELSESEEVALAFMREEEKLARDTYLYLHDKWSSPIFQNIASSEQKHMDAVLQLINKYDLQDPASIELGTFENEVLQELYDDLIEEGSVDLASAYMVGATIEEVDIVDLRRALEEEIDNADIRFVFENLMKGSENHLRAFVKNINSLGMTYTPQYLTQEDYQTIITSNTAKGGQGAPRN